MLKIKVWFCAVLIGAIVAGAFGSTINGNNAKVCIVDHQSETPCRLQTMGKDGSVNCTWNDEIISGAKCIVNFDDILASYSRGANRRNIGMNKDQQVMDQLNPGDTFEMPGQADLAKLKKIADGLNLNDKNQMGKIDPKTASRRNLNFNPFLMGLGSGLFGKPLFPKCPVHVKYCYRVPCGGYDNYYLEKQPKKCLSDPRCCYDYKLAFMKKIFGPKFMGGAPACYYGATSKQWVYITSHFKPWNPWYAKFILQAFEPFFNTNAYDFAGKLACSTDFGKKAYPVGSKSKLECNLVSGCWHEDLPYGHQCLMASDLIQSLFGKSEVYPSLFTNDPSDTKCSADWFQYGPKAYNRMPCGVGPSPDKVKDMLTHWCPIKECCLNYAMLSSDERSEFMSYYFFMQNFGSGFSPLGSSPSGGLGLGALGHLGALGGLDPLGGLGPLGGMGALGGLGALGAGASDMQNPFGSPDLHNPFGPSQGQTPWDPKIFYYLISSSSSTDLSKIFCPYRKASGYGIFPDLSEFAEGCCDIPKCYHKKKLVKRAYPYPYPPSTTKPPVQATWGAWGECNAACGSSGMKTRQCYVGHRHQPGLCPGPASERCYRLCLVQYTWSEWSPGPCSRSCDGGYRPFRRRCYGAGKEVDPSQCLGPATKSEMCAIEECETVYFWGSWSAGPCSRTSGRGYVTYTRRCYGDGKEVNPSLCDGSATKSEMCAIEECEPEYSWSQRYVQIGPCSVTCGQGYAAYGVQCVACTGEVVSDQLCPGRPSQQTRLCTLNDCPASAEWGQWTPVTPCGATCGPRGLRIERRKCYADGRPTDSSNCEGQDERIQRCAAPDCPTEYYWTGYSTKPCRRDPGGYCTIQRTRERSRRCYEFIGGQYVPVQPQSKCGNSVKEMIPCDPQECAKEHGAY